MKPYQRRATNAYPYFKVATWDAVNCAWKDGKIAFPSAEQAIQSVSGKIGRYRLSEVTENGRFDLEPFKVS